MAAVLDLARRIFEPGHLDVRTFTAQQHLGELELCILVIECQGSALQRSIGGFRVWEDPGVANAVA